MQYFGERLRDLRHEKHMTQKQLADKLDLSKGTISAYEQGKKYPSIEVLIKLCNILQVSADYLLGLSDDMQLMRSNLTDEQMSTFRKLIYDMEQYNTLKNSPK
ncbi:MAG: helix-turn-helix domain-containing protein [Lachnospiraceae bacterium]|nr:helix-turn-helix domain-containing protein [Lachnospiraceae bacterium]